MTDIVVVYVTAPETVAISLSKEILEHSLAACVNIVPQVRSIYMWEGALHNEAESLMIIKTARVLFEPLRDAIIKSHPYTNPEVIALPIEAAHAPYREWVLAESTGKPKGGHA